MTNLEAAIQYHGRGWAPIPLAPRAKRPLSGFDLRSRLACRMSAGELQAVWDRWPDSGVGLVMGAPSGNLIAVDVDPRNADAEPVEWALRERGVPASVSQSLPGGLESRG